MSKTRAKLVVRFPMEAHYLERLQQEFPEADRAAWFPLGRAAEKSVPGQRGLFAELARLLS